MAYQPAGSPCEGSVWADTHPNQATRWTASAPAQTRWSRHGTPASATNGTSQSAAVTGADGAVTSATTRPTRATPATGGAGRRAARNDEGSGEQQPEDGDRRDRAGPQRVQRQLGDEERGARAGASRPPCAERPDEGSEVERRHGAHDQERRDGGRGEEPAHRVRHTGWRHDGQGEEDDEGLRPPEHGETDQDAGELGTAPGPGPHGDDGQRHGDEVGREEHRQCQHRRERQRDRVGIGRPPDRADDHDEPGEDHRGEQGPQDEDPALLADAGAGGQGREARHDGPAQDRQVESHRTGEVGPHPAARVILDERGEQRRRALPPDGRAALPAVVRAGGLAQGRDDQWEAEEQHDRREPPRPVRPAAGPGATRAPEGRQQTLGEPHPGAGGREHG